MSSVPQACRTRATRVGQQGCGLRLLRENYVWGIEAVRGLVRGARLPGVAGAMLPGGAGSGAAGGRRGDSAAAGGLWGLGGPHPQPLSCARERGAGLPCVGEGSRPA